MFKKLDLKKFNRLSYKLFLFVLIIYFVFYLVNAFASIMYPCQIDYGEGVVLNEAVLLSNGESIYCDINHYPYILSYTPVFPLVCAAFIKILGVSFNLRFLPIVFAILTGVIIYKILREKTNKIIAIIFSLFFFASPYVYYWTRLLRVDSLALLCSLAGLYLVFKYENNKKVYWSIPFFILAVYTKQSYFAAPLAAFIYLFTKDKMLAVKNACLFGVIGGSLFLLLNFLTAGQFYLHAGPYMIGSFSIYRLVKSSFDALQIHGILFGFALAFVLYLISKKKSSLFGIYFIISAIFTLRVGRLGSSINYFLELIAVSCILSGLFLYKFQSQVGRKNVASFLVITLLFAQLVLLIHMPYILPGTPTSSWARDCREISAYIRDINGDILSEDLGLLAVNGKPALLQPRLFTELYKAGLWDQTRVIDDLKRDKFSAIILNFDLNKEGGSSYMFTKKMLNTMREKYVFQRKIGNDYIYTPK